MKVGISYLKYVSIFLVVAGVFFIASGSLQYTTTHISQKRSLQEAYQLTKTTNQLKLSEPLTTQPPSMGDIVGILQFPSLKEELPIIEGTVEEDLEKGVGHYTGSSFPNEKGQIVLSGHRDTVFRRLGELNLGDILTIVTPNGTYSYRIEYTQIVKANDRSVITLQKKEDILTLTTCYPFSFIGNAPERYIITAKPIEQTT
jgi:sortase A